MAWLLKETLLISFPSAFLLSLILLKIVEQNNYDNRIVGSLRGRKKISVSVDSRGCCNMSVKFRIPQNKWQLQSTKKMLLSNISSRTYETYAPLKILIIIYFFQKVGDIWRTILCKLIQFNLNTLKNEKLKIKIEFSNILINIFVHYYFDKTVSVSKLFHIFKK